MQTESCYLCDSNDFKARPGIVRDDASLKILECTGCGLVFVRPDGTRDEAFYAASGMHDESGELPAVFNWLHETAHDDDRRVAFPRAKLLNAQVLDVGCGVGGFLLKARETAASVVGVEPETRLQDHYQSVGLTVYPILDAIHTHTAFDLVTLFHVLEHIPDPRAMLSNMATILSETGEIIVEIPSSSDALLTVYQSDPFSRFTYWSCHLNLFNAHTLRLLAEQSGLCVNFIMQVQRYPLSNHLHWLAHGKPGGHKTWGFLDSAELDAAYAATLARIGACDTLIAGFSLGDKQAT